jgi:hypothetical protein
MKFTNTYNLPQSLVDALMGDTYDLKNAPANIISATTLIAPPKVKLLEQRHDAEIEVDVSEMLWRFIGTACHYVVEQATKGERLSEERMFLDVASCEVHSAVDGKKAQDQAWYKKAAWYCSAKIDLYDSDAKALQDYKITSVWAVLLDKEPKKEWVEQLNIGAFILRKVGFQTKKLSIIAIFKDWSASKAPRDYPSLPIPMKEIPIPMWSDDLCISFIRDRVQVYIRAKAVPDNEIPECSEEERWATKTTYAVMKAGNKRALAVKDSRGEAETQCRIMKGQYPKNSFSVEERPGEDKRCLNYCNSGKNGFCNYYNEHYKLTAPVAKEEEVEA